MRTINYSAETDKAKAAFIEAVQTAEAKRAAGEPYAEKGGALDKAKEAEKALNASIIEDGVKFFADMADSDRDKFFAEYLADWNIAGFSVDQLTDKKTGVVTSISYSDDGKSLRIPFSSIDGMCKTKIPTRGNWWKMAQIFVYNSELSAKADGNLTVKPLPGELMELRGNLGDVWSKNSKGALTDQLNEISKAIFPASVMPVMRKADCRDVCTAVVRYRGADDETKAMHFGVTTRADSVEKILFDKFRARANNVDSVYDDDFKRKDNSKGRGVDDSIRGMDESLAKAFSDCTAYGVAEKDIKEALGKLIEKANANG